MFRNKLNEQGKIVRNKIRLVYKGYAQVEGVYFDETFTPIARLEIIRMLLSLAAYKKFKVFQMDVKAAFLNGLLEEKVYIKQMNDFQLGDYPSKACKLKKVLYGLK